MSRSGVPASKRSGGGREETGGWKATPEQRARQQAPEAGTERTLQMPPPQTGQEGPREPKEGDALYPSQDWLYRWQGLVQNETVSPLAQKLLGIPNQRQQCIRPKGGPF